MIIAKSNTSSLFSPKQQHWTQLGKMSVPFDKKMSGIMISSYSKYVNKQIRWNDILPCNFKIFWKTAWQWQFYIRPCLAWYNKLLRNGHFWHRKCCYHKSYLFIELLLLLGQVIVYKYIKEKFPFSCGITWNWGTCQSSWGDSYQRQP